MAQSDSEGDGARMGDGDYVEGEESEEDDEEIPVFDDSTDAAGAAGGGRRAKRARRDSGAACPPEERTLYVSGFDEGADVGQTRAELDRLFTRTCGYLEDVKIMSGRAGGAGRRLLARVVFLDASGMQEALKLKRKRRDCAFLMDDGQALKVRAASHDDSD
jgi:hypothetical protein